MDIDNEIDHFLWSSIEVGVDFIKRHLTDKQIIFKRKDFQVLKVSLEELISNGTVQELNNVPNQHSVATIPTTRISSLEDASTPMQTLQILRDEGGLHINDMKLVPDVHSDHYDDSSKDIVIEDEHNSSTENEKKRKQDEEDSLLQAHPTKKPILPGCNAYASYTQAELTLLRRIFPLYWEADSATRKKILLNLCVKLGRTDSAEWSVDREGDDAEDWANALQQPPAGDTVPIASVVLLEPRRGSSTTVAPPATVLYPPLTSSDSHIVSKQIEPVANSSELESVSEQEE